MIDYDAVLLTRISDAKNKAIRFFQHLKVEGGYKYTITHDIEKYPAALLYGSWASILGLRLIGTTINWDEDDILHANKAILSHRRQSGEFLPVDLEKQKTKKSIEYLKLHCTNYSHGALLELNKDFDFETPYLNRFLDGDYLKYWLEGRSLLRPWEEGNNIVNVVSYIALCNENSVPGASDRLWQLFEWHQKNQNPKTGGFDNFTSPTNKQRMETLAGAVHNFHLHLYLGEPLGCEEVIARTIPDYLYQGNLTACLSIDYVELAIRTLPFSSDAQKLTQALIFHAESLLASQNSDGGWFESDNNNTPTSAAGFQDNFPSSCSYATWFRLCSLGMIAIVLLGDQKENWGFRSSLGMGYAPAHWPIIDKDIILTPLSALENFKIKTGNIPNRFKRIIINIGRKFL